MPATVLPDIDIDTELNRKEPGGPWKVVLWDDDFHTYDYVIEMLMEICQMSMEKAFQHAIEVDTEKKTIVLDVDGVYLTFELAAIKTVLPLKETASLEGAIEK